VDHRITYRVVETATRPKPGLALREVYSFEIPCSGNWTFDESFKPNLYVDVKDVWDQKIAAWNC
ncbi:MAG: PIG-L family deacetylase, partial [Candidatus Puniceispirillum sp.]